MKIGKLRKLDRKLEEVKLEARPAKNSNMNQNHNSVSAHGKPVMRRPSYVGGTKPEEKVIFVFNGTNRRKWTNGLSNGTLKRK
jgi:hypothetical protein